MLQTTDIHIKIIISDIHKLFRFCFLKICSLNQSLKNGNKDRMKKSDKLDNHSEIVANHSGKLIL